MSSHHVSPYQLKINSDLFSDKQNELKKLVGNLSLNEVKEDEQFIQTTKRIKEMILLKPVVIEEPKITGNNQIEKTFPPSYQDMWGGKRLINIITVEFRFDGSPELFNYSPNNITFSSSSNMRIYQPYGSDSIAVDVELSTLDKNTVLRAARAEMEMTFNLIEGNNTQAKQWSESIESHIEELLIAKRKQIIDLYS